MKKGTAILVRDGNAWIEMMKYFKYFGRRHNLVRLEPKPEPEPTLSDTTALEQHVDAAEYTLVRPQYRKAASTPRLKHTPSLVAIQLDEEIDSALNDARESNSSVDVDDMYRSVHVQCVTCMPLECGLSFAFCTHTACQIHAPSATC